MKSQTHYQISFLTNLVSLLLFATPHYQGMAFVVVAPVAVVLAVAVVEATVVSFVVVVVEATVVLLVVVVVEAAVVEATVVSFVVVEVEVTVVEVTVVSFVVVEVEATVVEERQDWIEDEEEQQKVYPKTIKLKYDRKKYSNYRILHYFVFDHH